MKKNHFFIKTFLIIFIFSGIPHLTAAQNAYQNTYPIAAYLLDYAKKLYEQEDFENARHEFSKLLIIDPDNKEAKEYLKKMGLDTGLYRSAGRLGLQEGSVYRENLSLRQQNKQLQEAVKNLREELSRNAAQIDSLREELRRQRQNTASRLSEYSGKVSALENLLAAKNQALANLHEELRIKRIEGDLRLADGERRLNAELSNSGQLNARLEEYAQSIGGLEDALSSKERELAALNDELESYRQSSQKWEFIKESQLQDKAYALEKLRDEFDSLQRRFAQAEKEILEKDSRLAEFEAKIYGLKSALQEKEIEIAGLSGSLKSRKEEWESSLLAKDNELARQYSEAQGKANKVEELNNELSSISTQLDQSEKAIREKDRGLAELETRLKALKSALQEKEIEIAGLGQQMNSQKTDLDGRLSQKDSEISGLLRELEIKGAQIREFQQKMDELKDALQAQELEIAVLKREFDLEQQAADKRFSEKEDELAAKYADIEELNLRLSAANDSLVHAEKEKLDKDSWIEHLENKMKNLEDASSGQLAKYLEKLNSLEDSLKAKDRELVDLNEGFELRSRQLQEELSAREAELAQKSAELEMSNDQLASRDAQIARREEENTIQVAEVSRLQEKIKQIELESSRQLGEYLDKLNGLEDSLKAKVEELSSLSREFDSHKQKLAEQLSGKDEQLAQQAFQISGLDKELVAARGYLAETEQAKADKDRQIKEFEVKIKEAANAAAAESEGYKNFIAALEEEANKKEQALGSLNVELDSAKKEFSGFLSAKDQELAQRNSEIDKLNLQVKEYENTLRNLEGSLFEKEKQLAKLQEQLKSSGEQYAGQLTAKEGELAEKVSQIKEINSQIAELNDKLAAAEGALSGKDRVFSDLESALNSQNQEFSDQLSAKEKQLQEQSLKIGELNNMLKESQDKVSALVNSLAGKEQETNELKGRLESDKEELGKHLSVREEELSKDAAKINELSRQLEEYKNLLNTTEDFLSAKDQALTDLNNQFEALKAEFQEQLAVSDRELKEKDTRIEDLNNQLDLSMEQLSQAEAQKAETDARIAVLEEKIREQEAALGGQIAEYEDRLNSLKESIQAKEKELQDTSRKVEELLRQKEELEAEANQQILSLQETMDKLQKSLRSEINDYKAKLEMAERGIVVTVLTDIAFDSGKADVLAEGTKILDKISGVLKDVSPDNHIVIEGHTDNVPIRYSGWKSNWELSSARALSVVHHLIDKGGLNAERFSANGYGEYRPIVDNSTEAGKRQNRRVEIVIQPPKIIKIKSEEVPSIEDNTGAGIQTPAPETISF